MARADISYDYEDFGMTSEELQAKYDREHPTYTNLAYNEAIAGSADIFPNYWIWVVQQIRKDDDEIPSVVDPDTQASAMVAITNIDMFAGYLTAWHQRKVATLQHMLSVPEGTEFTVNINGEEKSIILQGDVLTAFQGGVVTALSELGTLPFDSIPVEESKEANPEANGS